MIYNYNNSDKKMLLSINILVILALAVWYFTDKLDHLPGVPGASLFPCVISPWALTGKIMKRIQDVCRYRGSLLRIGRNKVGILNRTLALDVLSDPKMLKTPVQTSNPMIKYGLPFVSDPKLATSLRSSLFATALHRQVLSKLVSNQMWDTCLHTLLTEIEDTDTAIENYVKRALFLLVLELPEVESLPQMQTGPAARERMISSIIGDNFLLKYLVKTYRKLIGMPGVNPDIDGTMHFMQSLIDRKVNIAVKMAEWGFTPEQIKCHLATIFQAGTETTAFALKVAIINLGRHLDIQDQLYEKIATLPDRWDYTELIDACPEIMHFIYANLNYLTPIPLLRSRVCTEYIILDGKIFPEGTTFAISNDFIMQPFRRQFEMNGAREQNLSFGYGSRACPGKRLAEIELCMAISVIIKHFEVLDMDLNSNLEDECLSFVTRYWTRDHPLKFIPREK